MEFNWANIQTLQDAFPVLVNNEFLSDVKFRFADNSIIFAHSFILSLRSEEFYSNLKTTTGVSKLIQVDDVSNAIFLDFITFLYTDSNNLEIDDENVAELLKLSLKYKVSTLESKCRKVLTNKITKETACKFLETSTETNWNEFQKLCQDFIAKDYQAILNHESFLNTNEKILEIILKLDPVSDVNEFKIFESVMKWTENACKRDGIAFDGKNQRNKLGENLKLIRFGSMTLEEFGKCKQIAPEILNDSEILSIFNNITMKIKNNLGLCDQPRVLLLCHEKDSISLFDANTYRSRSDDPFRTNLIEFEISKVIELDTVVLNVHSAQMWLTYKLLENENIIKTEFTQVMMPGFSVKIGPIKLSPLKHYRLEYVFSNDCSYDSYENLSNATIYKIFEPKQPKLSESKDVEFKIFHMKSSIRALTFKKY